MICLFKRRLAISLVLALGIPISGKFDTSASRAQDTTGNTGLYSPKAREADAESIGKKSHAFQLQAKELHGQAEKYLIKTKALSQTSGAKANTAKAAATLAASPARRAGVKMSVPAPARPGTVTQSQYQANLKRFENHCRQYRLHMADFDKQMRRYEATLAEYRANCRRIDTHIDKFHVPNVERPHICPNIYMQEELTKAAQAVATRDRTRLVNATQTLVAQQQELIATRQKHLSAEKKALARAELRRLEETEGVLLEREYAFLAREYERLEGMRRSLEGAKP